MCVIWYENIPPVVQTHVRAYTFNYPPIEIITRMHDIAVYYIIGLCVVALGFLLYIGIDITKNNKNIAKKINQFRKADKFA